MKKNESITHNGEQKPKGCPREDVPVRGNSPTWYTQERLPYKGENFNALASLKSQPGVMFEEGVSTSAAVVHTTVMHPPIDNQDSFYKKAADFYAEIRERNSGAANYNVMYLAAYMWNVGVLHGLAHAAARAIKAMRSVMSLSADSPYILATLAGCPNYEDVASRLAQLTNAYTIVAKDIENLPLPHVTAFDRSRFLYSSLFADSKNPKPSLISFLPDRFVVMKPSLQSVEFETRATGINSTIEGSFLDLALNQMQVLLEEITTDSIMTIIRGDIRNAFGKAAYWEGLVNLPSTQLKLVPEDVEVMSQLENLSLIPRDADAGLDITYHMQDGNYVLDISIDGINDSPSLSRLWCDNNLVNYHGAKISDGQLLAITRMMYVGRKINRATKTDARIIASSGDTVFNSLLVTNVSRSHFDFLTLTESLLTVQTSTNQSAMKAAMANLAFSASNIAHFPMIILDRAPRAYLWGTDNYAIVSNVNLMNMTIIANRSLWDVRLPRGENGRLEKRA